MKRTQKANKLSLFGLAALLTFVSTSTVLAKHSHTTEAIEVIEVDVTITTVKTPEEHAAAIFAPLFTDPDYEVTESFTSLACKAVPHLEKSQHKILQSLAKELKDLCKNKCSFYLLLNLIAKYQGSLEDLFAKEEGKATKPKVLDKGVLLARINKAARL